MSDLASVKDASFDSLTEGASEWCVADPRTIVLLGQYGVSNQTALRASHPEHYLGM